MSRGGVKQTSIPMEDKQYTKFYVLYKFDQK